MNALEIFCVVLASFFPFFFLELTDSNFQMILCMQMEFTFQISKKVRFWGSSYMNACNLCLELNQLLL